MRHAMRRPIPTVVAMVLAAGVLAGAAWGILAPTEHLMVVAENRGIVLTGESAHRFDALALFVCIGIASGVVAAVGSWSVASARGPAMTVALVASSLVGAIVAAGVGLGVGRLVHPHVTSPPVGAVISFAPGLSTPLAVLAQPLAAALLVVVLASLSRSDDLRGRTDETEDTDEQEVSSVAAEPQTRP